MRGWEGPLQGPQVMKTPLGQQSKIMAPSTVCGQGQHRQGAGSQGGGRSKHPAQAREGGSGALFQFQEQLCACTPMPAQISTAIHVDQAD
jgi:hypothetical protein